MTNAMDDLFVKDLEEKFGDTGYAFWFKTLELLGSQGAGGVLDVSLTNWRRVIHSRRTDHLRRLYTFATERAKLKVEELGGDMVRITCPKFTEYADNYTLYQEAKKPLSSDFKVPLTQEEEEEEKKKKKEKEKRRGGVPSAARREAKPDPNKLLYGVHVRLLPKEYDSLLEKLKSEGRVRWVINKLDYYLGQNERNQRKYTSHYLAILNWVTTALEEYEKRTGSNSGRKDETKEQRLKRLNASIDEEKK
jgi:hypothetical protein